MRRAKIVGGTFAAMLLVSPGQAQPIVEGPNVFVFGGLFQDEFVWETAAFWRPHYEENVFVGAGYQNFFADLPANFHIGIEVGGGLRLGQVSSAEVWSGFVLKNAGLTLGDLTISPSATAGISVVTDTIGVETKRAGRQDRSVTALFYFAPEIAVSHTSLPGFEAFARIQHRSGGYGIIAEIDGSNAATLGFRAKL